MPPIKEKKYCVKGWIPLHKKYMTICGSNLDMNWLEESVTNKTVIKIYLCDRFCNNDRVHETEKEKKLDDYYKEYKSVDGFKIGHILSLIHQTYWSMVKEIYDYDVDTAGINNLSIVSFVFDQKNICVYPSTDS